MLLIKAKKINNFNNSFSLLMKKIKNYFDIISENINGINIGYIDKNGDFVYFDWIPANILRNDTYIDYI